MFVFILQETFGTLPSQTGQAIEASNELNQDVKNLKTKAVGVAGELNFELDAARRLEADADQVNCLHDKMQSSTSVKITTCWSRMEMFLFQAAVDAAEALNNAKQTQAAVGKTLQDINSLLADLSESSFYTNEETAFIKPARHRNQSVCFTYLSPTSFFFFFSSSEKPGVVDENHLKKLEDSLAGAQSDVEGRLRPRLRDMEEQEAVQRRRLTSINQDIDTILRDIANLEDILNAVPSGCYNSPPIEEP